MDFNSESSVVSDTTFPWLLSMLAMMNRSLTTLLMFLRWPPSPKDSVERAAAALTALVSPVGLPPCGCASLESWMSVWGVAEEPLSASLGAEPTGWTSAPASDSSSSAMFSGFQKREVLRPRMSKLRPHSRDCDHHALLKELLEESQDWASVLTCPVAASQACCQNISTQSQLKGTS